MPPDFRLLPANLTRIAQRFQQIAEPKLRYEHLLWFAKRAPELPEIDQVSMFQFIQRQVAALQVTNPVYGSPGDSI
jgi:sulfur transfer protein SufE